MIAISRKQASELCGEEELLLSDRRISIAPLELSTHAKAFDLTDQTGHYHHRNEIAEVFNKPTAQNIHHSQLFQESNTKAVSESLRYCNTVDAQEKYQLAHGNVVAVIGQAGLGKTTLTKLLVQKILREGLYDAEYVFYLRFRDIDYEKNMTFIQFLTNNSPFANDIAKKDLKQLLKKLSENNKVCIVCDGFDESVVTRKSETLQGKCTIYDKVKAETFIKHLLCGNLLPNAKKLFTSRPRQLFDLPKTLRPHFIVNVVGLNGDSQKQICNDICGDDNASAQVFNFIKDRPDLISFCYVPANCIMVMYCIHANLVLGHLAALERMDSITTILVATLGLFIENGHLRGGNFQTKNLSCLAYTAFVANRLFFESKDLKKAGISKHQATTFLTTRLGKNAALRLWDGIVTIKSYFSHLLLHEFFVAIYLMLFMKTKKFVKTLPFLKTNKFEVVARFSFGLCNSVTLNYMQNLIPSKKLNLTDYEQKKKMLIKLALEQVESAQNFADLFQVFAWFYELRDDAITEKAVSSLKSEIEVSGDIIPSDIPAFQYVLQLRKSPLSLIIPHPNLDKDRRKTYFVALDAILRSANVKVK